MATKKNAPKKNTPAAATPVATQAATSPVPAPASKRTAVAAAPLAAPPDVKAAVAPSPAPAHPLDTTHGDPRGQTRVTLPMTREERIRAAAYLIFLHRGDADGDETSDWTLAEAQIESERSA